MRYLDEYRDAAVAEELARQIAAAATRPWVLMEVCGGQTHSIVRYGLDRLIPAVELVHGPGCPVCVTPLEMIDRAHAIASRPEVIFVSFGDMLRVPGSRGDLLMLRSRGADVRVVYSPLDAVALARQHPERQVVFFGIGFETTAPANAMAILAAHRERLVDLDERRLPVRDAVRGACEILGLDPLLVANEGKLVVFVAARDADAVLAAMRAHPLGAGAAAIARVTDAHAGTVVARTAIGGERVLDLPFGEALPRIC